MIIGIDASLACRGWRTGVELYVFYIIKHLASAIPSSVEVRLYSDREFPSDLKKFIPAHWKQVVLSWPPKYLWTQVRLSFEMFLHPPDILFTAGHVEPFIHPACTVMVVHDVAAWRFPDAYSAFDRWYTLKLTLKAYSENPLMIVPSLFTKQELEALAHERGVRGKADIELIQHGFIDTYSNLLSSKIDTQGFFNKYGLEKNTPYILCLGRVEYKKNIDTIIRAFEKLKRSDSQFTPLKLVLAGKSGHGYEEIKKMLVESPYQNDIIETGWIPDQEAALLLRNAHSLIFVSRYEGFGFPILEALSLGVPVIASKNLCLEEVGDTLATYVSSTSEDEITDAIKKYLHIDPSVRSGILKYGKEHVLKFSWDSSARKTYVALLKAYKKLQSLERI